MACCCGSEYACGADGQFTVKRATRDLDSYRSKGPGVTTGLLRDGLTAAGAVSGSLLDIGSGIGALTFELLARGVSQAVDVDASSAYIASASQEADTRGVAKAIRFVQGDFLDVARELPPATIVTLDRVICCYPSYDRMLAEVLRHAERYLALSYPRDAWYVHAGNALENAGRRIRGRSFRTFVHPVLEMERIIVEAGFTRAVRKQTATWCADVYAKS
jgi:SAM-dependent methyltransferase